MSRPGRMASRSRIASSRNGYVQRFSAEHQRRRYSTTKMTVKATS